jgi:hypothetical protein
MEEASERNLQLRYPVRVDILVRIVFLWLFLWGGAVFEMIPRPHYSFYEDPLVVAAASIVCFLGGLFFLQGFIIIITHWQKFTFVIDKEGLHGVMGVTFIAWSEISSIGDKTRRYTLLGKRANFLTVRVRSVKRILQRERGVAVWVLRLGKSPDFIITNVKREDIRSALNDIQQMFAWEIRKDNIQIYY